MPDLYPKPFRWAVSWMVIAVVVFAVVTLATVGCIGGAVKQAETEQAVNRGHSDDESLPREARLIATDNYDAWSAQLYNLNGTRLPADVVRRLQRRGTLPADYEVGE